MARLRASGTEYSPTVDANHLAKSHSKASISHFSTPLHITQGCSKHFLQGRRAVRWSSTFDKTSALRGQCYGTTAPMMLATDAMIILGFRYRWHWSDDHWTA